jgi:hypothetical protein
MLGFLSNLATTYLAPGLAQYSLGIYIGLIVIFVVSLIISTSLFIRNLPHDSKLPPSIVPTTSQIPPDLSVVSGFLPEKLYRELVGRDVLIGDIMAALKDPNGKWMIGLDGIGGIGKTALAREIADLCQKENLFEIVVWDQAPKEQNRFKKRTGGTLTFETVLDAIARQIGATDIIQMNLAEKIEQVRTLVKTNRILVVLDNLETAKEDQNEIARKLLPLLNPGKAIFTSRHRFDSSVHAIHLSGLDADSALRFIRSDAHEKNIDRVSAASDKELKKIAKITGGSPLAIKLVVGQLIHLPLEVVLTGLKDVTLAEDNKESEYVRFYKAIFMPSWKLLSEDTQRLLISMANFVPNVGGTYDAVKATSGLSDGILSSHIEELWRFSFLEVGKSGSLNKVRYYLHALTQYFVLSDIVKVLK